MLVHVLTPLTYMRTHEWTYICKLINTHTYTHTRTHEHTNAYSITPTHFYAPQSNRVPMLVFLLPTSLIFFWRQNTRESARFYHYNGRTEEANDVLREVARVNGLPNLHVDLQPVKRRRRGGHRTGRGNGEDNGYGNGDSGIVGQREGDEGEEELNACSEVCDMEYQYLLVPLAMIWGLFNLANSIGFWLPSYAYELGTCMKVCLYVYVYGWAVNGSVPGMRTCVVALFPRYKHTVNVASTACIRCIALWTVLYSSTRLGVAILASLPSTMLAQTCAFLCSCFDSAECATDRSLLPSHISLHSPLIALCFSYIFITHRRWWQGRRWRCRCANRPFFPACHCARVFKITCHWQHDLYDHTGGPAADSSGLATDV